MVEKIHRGSLKLESRIWDDMKEMLMEITVICDMLSILRSEIYSCEIPEIVMSGQNSRKSSFLNNSFCFLFLWWDCSDNIFIFSDKCCWDCCIASIWHHYCLRRRRRSSEMKDLQRGWILALFYSSKLKLNCQQTYFDLKFKMWQVIA